MKIIESVTDIRKEKIKSVLYIARNLLLFFALISFGFGMWFFAYMLFTNGGEVKIILQ